MHRICVAKCLHGIIATQKFVAICLQDIEICQRIVCEYPNTCKLLHARIEWRLFFHRNYKMYQWTLYVLHDIRIWCTTIKYINGLVSRLGRCHVKTKSIGRISFSWILLLLRRITCVRLADGCSIPIPNGLLLRIIITTFDSCVNKSKKFSKVAGSRRSERASHSYQLLYT